MNDKAARHRYEYVEGREIERGGGPVGAIIAAGRGASGQDAAPKPAADRPLVVFTLDGQRYGLPLACVQRSMRAVAITPLPGAPAIVLGMVDVGGVVVPVVDIRSRFKHPPRPIGLSDHLILATAGKRTVALPVDQTKGVVVAAPDGYASAVDIVPGLAFVDGVMAMEDGLILIHDLRRLLSLEEEEAIDRTLSARDGSDAGSGRGRAGVSASPGE